MWDEHSCQFAACNCGGVLVSRLGTTARLVPPCSRVGSPDPDLSQRAEVNEKPTELAAAANAIK